MSNLESALYLWAKDCDINKALIDDWISETITKIANQGGQSVASTTANGISVNFMGGSTLLEWFTSLMNVKNRLNTVSTIRNKTVLAFR